VGANADGCCCCCCTNGFDAGVEANAGGCEKTFPVLLGPNAEPVELLIGTPNADTGAMDVGCVGPKAEAAGAGFPKADTGCAEVPKEGWPKTEVAGWGAEDVPEAPNADGCVANAENPPPVPVFTPEPPGPKALVPVPVYELKAPEAGFSIEEPEAGCPNAEVGCGGCPKADTAGAGCPKADVVTGVEV